MARKVMRFSAILCVLLVGAAMVWAASSNFAGTWVLDKAKSESLRGPMANGETTITITQTDKDLTVESKTVMPEGADAGGGRPGGGGPGGSQTTAYKLDGTEVTGELGGRMPGKFTNKAKWLDDGKKLELTSVRNVSFQGNDVTLTTSEHWELLEDGKVLKIHRTSETPRGTQETTLVLNKK